MGVAGHILSTRCTLDENRECEMERKRGSGRIYLRNSGLAYLAISHEHLTAAFGSRTLTPRSVLFVERLGLGAQCHPRVQPMQLGVHDRWPPVGGRRDTQESKG